MQEENNDEQLFDNVPINVFHILRSLLPPESSACTELQSSTSCPLSTICSYRIMWIILLTVTLSCECFLKTFTNISFPSLTLCTRFIDFQFLVCSVIEQFCKVSFYTSSVFSCVLTTFNKRIWWWWWWWWRLAAFSLYVAVADCRRLELFRITINITSVPYHAELADRSSADFRELADALSSDIDHIYRDIPGQQSANVLQFRSVVVVVVTRDCPMVRDRKAVT